ncbi:hypothetical protein Q3G72_010146 [Acer saccharum]|nr:hypothetical protein Q3G72_010146 [Acer saccharum]
MASCCQFLVANFDSIVAEIMAISKGILFGKDCGLAPCVLESNKAEAIDRVLNNKFRNASYGYIISDITDLQSEFNGLSICAIPRSANRVAQKLAKYALDISKDNPVDLQELDGRSSFFLLRDSMLQFGNRFEVFLS